MVVKKGLKKNLVIKQDSANMSNYGVKTIPLDLNILLISLPSKVAYYNCKGRTQDCISHAPF